MGELTRREILFEREFPPMGPITEEVIDCAQTYTPRFRSSMRIATGRIYTDKEIQDLREKAKRLP